MLSGELTRHSARNCSWPMASGRVFSGHQCRTCVQDSSHRQLSTRRTLCAVRAGAELTDAEAELEQVRDSLILKREEMKLCAEREDYSGAATIRDSVQHLELHFRELQLKQEHEARSVVKYRLGHVVIHRRFGYRGVIAGFTYECEASDTWCRMMKVDALPLGRKQPFYNVLVDERDRPNTPSTYVAQENIIAARAPKPIQHPLVDEYFTEFKDGAYEPKYSLASQFPQQPL